MVAPRALVFQPLVKGNEALGTRLYVGYWKLNSCAYPGAISLHETGQTTTTSCNIHIVIYIAGVFPLQRAHSLANSWTHDTKQWNCFPPNAMSGQHYEYYDVKRETVHCYRRNVERCYTSFANKVFVFYRFEPFVLLYNINDWSFGEQWILFSENLREKKIHCHPWHLHETLDQFEIWANNAQHVATHHNRVRPDARNMSRPTMLLCVALICSGRLAGD